jgi:hypothetical protein
MKEKEFMKDIEQIQRLFGDRFTLEPKFQLKMKRVRIKLTTGKCVMFRKK